MKNYTVVSSDCHGGIPWEAYKPYVEKRFHAAFDEWLAGKQKTAELAKNWEAAFFQDGYKEQYDEGAREITGHDTELGWAPEDESSSERLRQLELDGIVAEVIFPDGRRKESPWWLTPGERPELQLAGARAYNRWAHDYCSGSPDRQLACAALVLHDVESAVAEMKWAKQSRMKLILLPSDPVSTDRLPAYSDPVYEPIWNAAEDLDLPLAYHFSAWTGPNFGMHQGSDALMREKDIYSQRALWHMILSGVFERHPRLRVAVVESGANWVPTMLSELDRLAHGHGHPSRDLPLLPSEYFDRNCWVCHSGLEAKKDWGLRYEIGVDNLMWGSDFPHLEGWWPRTRERLGETFAALPEAEIRAILAGNAAEFYGLDLAAYDAIAANIGPSPAEFAKAQEGGQ